MQYGQAVKPIAQKLDEGLLVRTLKLVSIDDVTNELQPYGLSPMTGRPLVGKNVHIVMGFEGGTGISIANATFDYGKKGTLLRRKLRIDKCPWPGGQEDIRVRCTTIYGQTIGANGTTASPAVIVKKWFRNTEFKETFSSNIAPSNSFLNDHGFGPSSASLSVELIPRGIGPGLPLVQDDENGLTDTFITAIYSNPSFSHGLTYLAGSDTHTLFLPCPHWVKHRLNFAEGFVGVKYNDGDPLGVVMGITTTVEAIGWDTGFHDIEGWHAETILDPYQIPKPNSYEYPNYPISDPFNPVGDGVG